jgi:hypothetical protein
MLRIRTTFAELKVHRRRSGVCPVCGKVTVKQKTFMQTLNPYNRNAAGEIKTTSEIYLELIEKADGWEPDFRHQGCS